MNAWKDWRQVRTPAILQGILPIRRSEVAGDVVAGLTLASLAVPEVMGYASIAGMPLITGLYTMLVPVVLFALLGSSRHLVVAADSATAAILASALVGMAHAGSDYYVALAQLLALLTAALLLLGRVVGLGFLADFLSRSVLIGFLTGVGVQVALSQVPELLGIAGGDGRVVAKLVSAFGDLSTFSPTTLAISVGMLAFIVGAKRFSKRIPAALLAVVAAIAISWTMDLGSKGIATVGTIPGGIPTFQLPQLELSLHLLVELMPTAATMSLVILAQSAATSRAYAARYNEDNFDEDADLVGLGFANLGAGLSGTFVVNGSPTKTAMADNAGARSQVAQLTAAGVILVVLLFLTTPLGHMPEAALAAVVFLIGIDLIDIRGMRTLFHQARAEFWIAALTAIVVVLVSVEAGISLAVALSLIEHTRKGYRPTNFVIASRPKGGWEPFPVSQPKEFAPGLIVYRFSHSLYYANTRIFTEEVDALTRGAKGKLRYFCIYMISVDDVDFTAGQEILLLQTRLAARDVRLLFVMVSDEVMDELRRYGIVDEVGHDAFFDTLEDLAASFPPSPTTADAGDSVPPPAESP